MEEYATFSYDGVVVAVSRIEGIELCPWRDPNDGRPVKRAIFGSVLSSTEPAYEYFIGRLVDHDRNPVTYHADPAGFPEFNPSASTLTQEPSCWCLLANPATYDVEAALEARPVVLWNVGRLRRTLPSPGDPVLVWRTRGGDGNRGLIGRGVVDGDVAFVPDDDDPFWVDASRGLRVEPRVPIRWSRLVQPVWIDDAPKLLGALKVSRSQGLPIVPEDTETWNAAARLTATLPTGDPPTTQALRGQGWISVVEVRLAIERAAMDAATAHFVNEGYAVDDVHATRSYDLSCVRGNEEIHVEVKGTTTDGAHVLLTRGEVLHAQRAPHPVLFVLTHLKVTQADGGTFKAITDKPPTILDPWQPSPDTLEALSYRYRLPAD